MLKTSLLPNKCRGRLFVYFTFSLARQVYSKVLYEQKQLVIVTIESSIQVEVEGIQLMSRQEFLNICPKLLGVCSTFVSPSVGLPLFIHIVLKFKICIHEACWKLALKKNIR